MDVAGVPISVGHRSSAEMWADTCQHCSGQFNAGARSVGREPAEQTRDLPMPTADDVRIQIFGKTRGGVLAGVRARRGADVSVDHPARGWVRKSTTERPGRKLRRTWCPTKALFPRAVVPILHNRNVPSWSARDRSSCSPWRGFCKHSPKCTRRGLFQAGPEQLSESPHRAR